MKNLETISDFGRIVDLNRVRFHRYNFAPKGFVQEGIDRRIHQGVGGPNHLEPGAEVQGHVHLPKDKKLNKGDVIEMDFQDEKWLVNITEHTGSKTARFSHTEKQINQDVPKVKGFAITGIVVSKTEIKK